MRWQQKLDGNVEFLHTLSIETAEETFAQNKGGIDDIVVIACMNSDKPNTMPLIRKFREASKVPIMGVSQFQQFRVQLKKAGCTHESTREELPKKLLEMLK